MSTSVNVVRLSVTLLNGRRTSVLLKVPIALFVDSLPVENLWATMSRGYANTLSQSGMGRLVYFKKLALSFA